MQVTLDGRILDPADEVDWADGLELLQPVDAFVLGRDPYPRELAYARTAAETPHLVLSTTLTETTWPTARIVREPHRRARG